MIAQPFTNASKNQTSAAVQVPSGRPILVQATVSGATLTAGTLKSEGSLDGVHFDATTYPFSYAYGDIINSLVLSAASGFLYLRFTIASLAFNYGKTQTTGTGTSDLTIAGAYTPTTAHTYKIKISDADVDVTAASTTLTTTGTKPVAGTIVTIGAQPYTFRDTLTGAAAIAASVILTSSGIAPTDGDTVVLGSTTYMFKDTLDTGPDVPNQVKTGSAAVCLDNLLLAVNAGANSGNYGIGTTANADITATTNGNTTQLFVAKVAGAAGNSLASTHPIGTTYSFPAAHFASGADIVAAVAFEVLAGANAAASLDNLNLAVENGVANNSAGQGTTFGTGTTMNATVSATTNTDTTQLFVAKSTGAAGNAIVSTVTGANSHLSFTNAAHFTGGLDAVNDLFEWNKDGGAYSAPIAIVTGSPQTVVDGLTVQFATDVEHTLGDEWTVTPPSVNVYVSA